MDQKIAWQTPHYSTNLSQKHFKTTNYGNRKQNQKEKQYPLERMLRAACRTRTSDPYPYGKGSRK